MSIVSQQKRGVAPSIRSRSGILTNAATTGQQGPPNTMLAAGGAGGGTGAGATPAVIAAQRHPSRTPNRPVAAPTPARIAGPMAQAAPAPARIAGPMAQAPAPVASRPDPGALAAARYERAWMAPAVDRPAPGVLDAARYARAAEVYADPVTGAPTPAYEEAQAAPTFGTPGAMGGPTDQEVLNWLSTSDAQNFLGTTTPAPAASTSTLGVPIEDAYTDMFTDLREDAETAFDTSEDYFTTEGEATTGFYDTGADLSGQYFDDRGTAAEDYFGGTRDDALEYLTGREGREQQQILDMANMRRGNVNQQYQHMIDALNAEQARRGGVYDQLETQRGARLNDYEAQLLSQMEGLEGQRLTQEQAMMDAMSGRYTGAQGGLDQRRLDAEAALREQGISPEAYTAAVGAETAGLLGSQALSSQDLQGRLASIAASEATDRSLGATGLFQDARAALADELFGGRANLAEDIAGRRTGLGLQNMQALGGINTGELGSQHTLANEIAQGRFGANQAYSTGMYNTGEEIAAGRFEGSEAARTGAFGAGQAQRAGIYGAQQTYNTEMSRINEAEASGRISRAEAAQAKTEAEAKAAQAQAAESAQFATIDQQMGLTPGTAEAMAAGGLLGDLYGDLMGEPEANEYENMMPWTDAAGETYFVDPEIAMRAEIDAAQSSPVGFYPVNINGQMVPMPITGWGDVEASQEYEARR